MHRSASVADPSGQRPNLDGGRPTDSRVLHLEGHVEEIVALSDDAKALAHIGRFQQQVAGASQQIATEIDAICSSDDCSRLAHLARTQRHIAGLSARMAQDASERVDRLTSAIIPEVQRCYATAERALTGAVLH